MSPYSSRLSVLLALMFAWLLSACTSTTTIHGAVIDEEDLETLQIGVSTSEEVQGLLGTASTFTDESERDWLYITITRLERPLRRPFILERRVLWLEFSSDDVLVARNTFLATDEEVVSIDPNTTPSTGRKLTFIEDLFGLNR